MRGGVIGTVIFSMGKLMEPFSPFLLLPCAHFGDVGTVWAVLTHSRHHQREKLHVNIRAVQRGHTHMHPMCTQHHLHIMTSQWEESGLSQQLVQSGVYLEMADLPLHTEKTLINSQLVIVVCVYVFVNVFM